MNESLKVLPAERGRVSDYRYIIVIQSGLSPSGKTKIFRVDSKEAGFEIGYVRFYPKWRKYVYEPLNDTIYEQVCLRDIASFIEEATKMWRIERAKQKGHEPSGGERPR